MHVKNERVSAIWAKTVVPGHGPYLERRLRSESWRRKPYKVALFAGRMNQQAVSTQRRIVSDSPDPDAIRAVQIEVIGKLVLLLSGRKNTY